MHPPKNLRSTLRTWLPPALEPVARSLFGDSRFEGDYPSFAAAAAQCEGYGADIILKRVRRAALAVKAGEAAYERDSVTFTEREYVWQVLASLLWVAAQRGSSLHVLDFGGSLGSSYYQHRPMLSRLRELRWSVVEQAGFVACGQREFADETLQFYGDIDAALERGRPDVVLLSGVAQYLERPYEFLERLVGYGFDFLIVDRTPLLESDRDRICVQRVSNRMYPAAYPAWFFGRERFLRTFAPAYRLVTEFSSADRANIPSEYRGFLFERS